MDGVGERAISEEPLLVWHQHASYVFPIGKFFWTWGHLLGMTRLVSFQMLSNLLERILQSAGASREVARIIAANCANCERDGSKSHGVFRMRGYASTLRSGWADGAAVPEVEDAAQSFVRVAARNGFAQPALLAASELAIAKARISGACIIAIRDSLHFSALWPDVEPFAEQGLIALSVVNSMAVTVPVGAQRPVFGTTPLHLQRRSPDVIRWSSTWQHRLGRMAMSKLPDARAVYCRQA